MGTKFLQSSFKTEYKKTHKRYTKLGWRNTTLYTLLYLDIYWTKENLKCLGTTFILTFRNHSFHALIFNNKDYYVENTLVFFSLSQGKLNSMWILKSTKITWIWRLQILCATWVQVATGEQLIYPTCNQQASCTLERWAINDLNAALITICRRVSHWTSCFYAELHLRVNEHTKFTRKILSRCGWK